VDVEASSCQTMDNPAVRGVLSGGHLSLIGVIIYSAFTRKYFPSWFWGLVLLLFLITISLIISEGAILFKEVKKNFPKVGPVPAENTPEAPVDNPMDAKGLSQEERDAAVAKFQKDIAEIAKNVKKSGVPLSLFVVSVVNAVVGYGSLGWRLFGNGIKVDS
jgi:hypothetical protein